ncbi:hypothetical protein [Raoultella sp. BIGb0149]|uniref:hypothetical protein n=1 Tax=Raoultella sp. BIGb0149 TaxID=2485116 RepID=UPI001060AA14|nr:hypothetical protein [Raoultella sp. BIGb0149]
MSTEQLALLDFYSENAFVNELSEHCKKIFPKISNELGSKKLKESLTKSINKAKASNITQRGSLQLYIDMSIVLGSGFDTDPTYSSLSSMSVQCTSSTELERSMRIHSEFNTYLTGVIGENNTYILDFKHRLANEIFHGFSHLNFNEKVFHLLSELYPQKCIYLSSDKVKEIINIGFEYSAAYYLSFNVRAVFILVLFIVGHNFETDYFHLHEAFFSSEKKYDDWGLICKAKEFVMQYIDALIT